MGCIIVDIIGVVLIWSFSRVCKAMKGGWIIDSSFIFYLKYSSIALSDHVGVFLLFPFFIVRWITADWRISWRALAVILVIYDIISLALQSYISSKQPSIIGISLKLKLRHARISSHESLDIPLSWLFDEDSDVTNKRDQASWMFGEYPVIL